MFSNETRPAARNAADLRLRAALLVTTALTMMVMPAVGQDATWGAAPGDGDFNTGANWTPATVPTGTAFFDTSGTTALTFSASASLGGWTFNPGASAYNFTNDYTLLFTGAGIVVNGGSATITTNNTMQFLGASTAGSATITNDITPESSGTLNFNSTSTAGSATITNNSALQFNNASRAGNAAITNNDRLRFFDTSTASNATIINNDALQFFGASKAGSATITNNSAGTINFDDTSTAGSATITNNIAGTLNFNDTSTAGNAAITNNDALQFFGASTAGGAAIANESSGTLNFDDTSTAGNAAITNNGAGTINFWEASTAGSAIITNNIAGTLNFNDTSTAGSATFNSFGTLNFSNTSTAGSATITNNLGLQFNNASTAGNAAIANNYLLRFFDTSTAGNATITNDNALQFFGGSTAGSAAITNNGIASFTESSTAGSATITNDMGLQFFDKSTAGNAALVNNVGATVDFSNSRGPNTDDKLSAGSLAGGGTFSLGRNELTVGGNGLSTTVTGVIADGGANGGVGGALVKTGTGTLTLSGTNTYTGATTVNAGTLAVNGSILASSGVQVNSGGSIGGTGTFATVVVGSGGTIAPGNSIGTLLVDGDVTFNVGSFFDVEVDRLGNADLLDVINGTATVDGGTLQVLAAPGAYAASTLYTVVTANFVTGEFDDVTSDLAFLTPTLSYDLQNVFLTLDRNNIAFAEAATTGNQRRVASAAEALGAGNAVYDAILALTDEEAQAAYEALSGEGHATIKGMLVENSTLVLDALLGRLQTLRSAPETTGAVSAYAGDPLLSGESAYAGRVWGQLYGGLGSRAGDGNAAASSFGGGGLVLGTETEIGDWQLGFSAQVGSSGFAIPDRATTGSSTDVGLGVYGGTQWGDTGFGFGASFTRSGIATTRKVQFPGFSETLTASYGATTGQLFAEINHEFDLGDVSLTPFAQLAYSGTATDAFTEQGGASALSSSANLINSTFATLGLRAEHQFLFGEDGLASVSGALAWRHGFVAAPVASNSFAGGGAFTASGAPAGSDALVLETGFSLDLANGLDVSLDYAGQISAQGQSHGLSARLGGAF